MGKTALAFSELRLAMEGRYPGTRLVVEIDAAGRWFVGFQPPLIIRDRRHVLPRSAALTQWLAVPLPYEDYRLWAQEVAEAIMDRIEPGIVMGIDLARPLGIYAA